MHSSATTLRGALMAALSRHNLDPRITDTTRTPGVLVTCVDGSAVVVGNPCGDRLEIALTEYEAVAAYRYPPRFDPAHPPGDFEADPDHLTTVYETPEPCGGKVYAARADIDRLALILAAEVTRPHPEALVSDVLLYLLAKEGLSGALANRGWSADGIVIDLGDGTHVMISDTEDVQITYPLSAGPGLLAKRYRNDDLSQERVVYRTNDMCKDALEDARTAVAAVREDSRLPLGGYAAPTPGPGPAGSLVRCVQAMEQQRVSDVLLTVLRDKGLRCSLRVLGSGEEGVSVDLAEGTHIVITDPYSEGLEHWVRDHYGLEATRVCGQTLRQDVVYTSQNPEKRVGTFAAVADILAAVAAIAAETSDPSHR